MSNDVLPPVMVPGPVGMTTPEDTKQMMDILRALDEGVHIDHGKKTDQTLNVTQNNADILAMKKILESIDNLDPKETARQLVAESYEDLELREALSTRKTASGVKIGSYKIVSKLLEGSKQTKTYDIVNSYGDKIADSLMVYEAAYGIVKALNVGKTITDRNIIKILSLEESYASYRADALRAKKLYRKCMDERDISRAEIFETKYNTARERALAAKDEITVISQKL